MVFEEKINVDDVEINYAKEGWGQKYILCLPNVLGSWDLHYKKFFEDFDKDKFTVVAWDPPGYGKSRPPSRHEWCIKAKDGTYNQRDASYARKLMRKLGLTPFTVLGWCDGGVTAMFMAYNYPKDVENLVIWGTSAYITDYEMKNYEPVRHLTSWSEKTYDSVVDFYGEAYAQECWSDYIDHLIESMRERGGNKCRELMDHKIKQPCLILYGKGGMMVPKGAVEYLEENMDASVVAHDGGLHDLHTFYHKWFCKNVSDFIIPTQIDTSDEEEYYRKMMHSNK